MNDLIRFVLAPERLPASVAWLGFVLAFAFGALGQRVRFCTMGAVSDAVSFGDWGRMRMWLLAIAVAAVAANAMHLAGVVDLERSIYPAPRFAWLSYALGGLLFGVGMTLAGGCGSRNLMRLGAGNLKALVVLIVLAISAYMTMKGLLALPRVALVERVAFQIDGGQGLPNLLSRASGAPPEAMRWLATGVLGIGTLALVLRDRAFRGNRERLLGGAALGLIVAAGWYITGHLGYLAEDPHTLEESFAGTNSRRPESLSFVGPLGYGLELLLLWTDRSLHATFGIAAVAGVFAGSTAWALAARAFRWEGFTDVADLRDHILGGALMGFGGVLALGCSIGQGMAGLSTLALGSFLAFGGILAGSAATLNYLYRRLPDAQ